MSNKKNIIKYSSSGIPLHENKAVENIIQHGMGTYPSKHYIIKYKDGSVPTLVTDVGIRQQLVLNKLIKPWPWSLNRKSGSWV